MTLVQLRQFIVLARAGSFVKAAGLLHMTQPALSRAIKALEDELGQLLFDRIGRRIELTAFGVEVLGRSQWLVEEAEQLRQCGRGLEPTATGRVRLGLSSGPGALLTGPLLTHFAQHFPNYYVDITRANTDALTQMLRDRLVDALVVDVRALRPAPDLKVSGVAELEGAFLVRRGHPLKSQARVSFAQLTQYPMASTPLSDELARILVERYGERAHPRVMVRYTGDEIDHLVEVALHTDTVVLAVRSAGRQLVPLALTPPLRATARYGLVTLAQRAESLVLAEVRRVMAQVMR